MIYLVLRDIVSIALWSLNHGMVIKCRPLCVLLMLDLEGILNVSMSFSELRSLVCMSHKGGCL